MMDRSIRLPDEGDDHLRLALLIDPYLRPLNERPYGLRTPLPDMQLHLLNQGLKVLQLLKAPFFGKFKQQAIGELQ
jgi:hypothetical protein